MGVITAGFVLDHRAGPDRIPGTDDDLPMPLPQPTASSFRKQPRLYGSAPLFASTWKARRRRSWLPSSRPSCALARPAKCGRWARAPPRPSTRAAPPPIPPPTPAAIPQQPRVTARRDRPRRITGHPTQRPSATKAAALDTPSSHPPVRAPRL